jgi:hypothetical protein
MKNVDVCEFFFGGGGGCGDQHCNERQLFGSPQIVLTYFENQADISANRHLQACSPMPRLPDWLPGLWSSPRFPHLLWNKVHYGIPFIPMALPGWGGGGGGRQGGVCLVNLNLKYWTSQNS